MASLVVRERTGLNELLAKHTFIKRGKALTGNYLILVVPDEDVLLTLELLEDTKVDTYPLVVGLLGREDLDASGITEIQQQPYLDLRGRGVLLGFVDTGIDYTLPAFKYEDNTSKISFIWDQTIDGNHPGDGIEFGAEYSQEQLNEALQSENPFDIVPHRDTVGHGTFLASVAGSREEGDYIGAAPDSEIVMVKLRRVGQYLQSTVLIPPEQENAFETADVMLGIQYILEKANALQRPVAICISVGTNQGGHDGYSIFEEYLSRISHVSGVALCSAVGNESNTGHHATGIITKTGDVYEVGLNVVDGADDIYISMFNNASDKVSISVVSPTGEMVGRVPARNGAESTTRLVFEKSTVVIAYYFPVEESGSQLSIVKIYEPTPGIWRILIHGDIIINGKIDIWLPITGFVTPGVEFLTPSPDCTIVVPATAMGVIACGAYNAHDKSLYASTSWGPTRLPAIMPDLVAPGVNAAGIYPTGYGAMSGTSVSAAITTGACALLLQWGIINRNETFMDTYLIRANLIRGCNRDPGMTYPNNQWGYGKLDLHHTFELLRVM